MSMRRATPWRYRTIPDGECPLEPSPRKQYAMRRYCRRHGLESAVWIPKLRRYMRFRRSSEAFEAANSIYFSNGGDGLRISEVPACVVVECDPSLNAVQIGGALTALADYYRACGGVGLPLA